MKKRQRQSTKTLDEIWERKKASPLSDSQTEYWQCMHNCDIVLCSARAGTGKSYLAAGFAAKQLLEGKTNKILITRPTITCGPELGFLPGLVTEKVTPYLGGILESLGYFLSKKEIDLYIDNGIIEIAALQFLRGRNATDIWILDEAQNATTEQLLMFLTRIADGGKLILNGDISQSDIKIKSNPFASICAKLDGVDGIGVVKLNDRECYRHPLINEIYNRLT